MLVQVVDRSMPIMGGMEATRLIRAYETQNNLAPTPIIALGAHGSAYSFHTKVALGFVTFRANLLQRLVIGSDVSMQAWCATLYFFLFIGS